MHGLGGQKEEEEGKITPMCDYIGDWPPRGRCLKGMKRKHEKNQASLDKQKETSRDKRKRMCLNKEKERLEMGKRSFNGYGRQSISKQRNSLPLVDTQKSIYPSTND